ncbi:MAG TPA: hypothetical protein VMU50_19715 [Polyangia bacterium]|nr:hypothetical protein [Polyangia bacterium]
MIITFKINRRPVRVRRRGGAPVATAALVAALALLAASPARADRRAYATTYEAVTAPKGELDVETWSTYARDGEVLDGPATRGFRNMLELEYGLTNRWDVALYNMLDVDTVSNDAAYAGLKVETRYRLIPAGEWFVDPVLYFEFQYLRVGDASHKAEVKLIVARDFGPWNLALNLAGETERMRESGDFIPEAEYAFGVSRELGSPTFKLGVEIFGKAEKPRGESWEWFAWAGPALSWATGLSSGALHGMWITVGAGRGLTDDSQAWYGRGIVGLQF